MKVRIFNNRLALECKVPNLDEAPDSELRRVAAKYQIGWQRFISKDIEVISRGRTVKRKQESLEPKSRRQIIDEIRNYLTIKFFIPREYWTADQEEAFNANDLINEKDILREQDIKKKAGIYVILPPLEKVKDDLKEAEMYVDLTEDQWEFLKSVFNKKYTRIKDDNGRTIKKKESYVHRLMARNYIPETKEEEKKIEEEKEKKEAKNIT